MSCFPMGRGLEIGLCSLPRMFLFSSSKWSDMVHCGCYFYSSAACFTRKITELRRRQGQGVARRQPPAPPIARSARDEADAVPHLVTRPRGLYTIAAT